MKEQYSASYTSMNFCLKMTADGLGGGGRRLSRQEAGSMISQRKKTKTTREIFSARSQRNSVDEYGIPRVEM